MSEAGFGPGDKVYVIDESGLHDELRAVGLDTAGLEDADKHVKTTAFTRDFLDPAIRAVVVGLDSKFNYYKVAMAASYLRYNEGCKLIATNGCVAKGLPCGLPQLLMFVPR
jgi:4-nitrophenyl phosphatase